MENDVPRNTFNWNQGENLEKRKGVSWKGGNEKVYDSSERELKRR